MDARSAVAADPEKCTGCRTCELACSLRNYAEVAPSRARIFIVRDETGGLVATTPVVCHQCEEALCALLCPADALVRDDSTGAVVVAARRCLGCRTCVVACPYGAPSVDPQLGITQKCDLCGGEPTCVRVCPNQALELVPADDERLHPPAAGGRYLAALIDAATAASQGK